MTENSHKAPLTLKLIVRVNETLSRLNMTQVELRVELNRFLCAKRKIKADHAGTVKLSRWLNPTGPNWSEPKGEIVLAMKAWLEAKN